MGANPTIISQWFDLLKKIQMEVGIVSPGQIWSGDETGVQNVPKEIKVLGIKNIRTFQQVSSEQGETSTILSFVRWFKFTLKPPYSIARGKLRLAIWDTSFWTF